MRTSFGGRCKGIAAVNVKELCLGALTLGDASGYDLKRFFETTFSHFCAAGFGSIYPALAELAAEGLVCGTGDAQGGRPERKLYHLTAAGRRTFVDCLQQAVPTHRVKSDFLLVLFFGHLLAPQHLAAFLDQRIADLEAQIHCLQTHPHAAPATRASTRLVCGYGLAVQSAAHAYLVQHRDEILATARSSRPAAANHWNAARHSDARQA